MIKRQIISLYEDDFKRIDASGRISALYHSIPAQLSKDSRKYRITTAIGKRNNTKAEELLYELIDSKTILPCYNSTDPRVSLADTKDFDSYKLYLSDTGLFVTLMFIDRPVTENDVYAKLLSDKLLANLGFLYENLIAQMIASSGRELFYHTWEKEGSIHYYEIDFLISEGSKINAFEIKSSGTGKHESIKTFYKKFSQNVHNIEVTFGRAIRQNQMATFTNDFEKLTGRKPLTVREIFEHMEDYLIGSRTSTDN